MGKDWQEDFHLKLGFSNIVKIRCLNINLMCVCAIYFLGK